MNGEDRAWSRERDIDAVQLVGELVRDARQLLTTAAVPESLVVEVLVAAGEPLRVLAGSDGPAHADGRAVRTAELAKQCAAIRHTGADDWAADLARSFAELGDAVRFLPNDAAGREQRWAVTVQIADVALTLLDALESERQLPSPLLEVRRAAWEVIQHGLDDPPRARHSRD